MPRRPSIRPSAALPAMPERLQRVDESADTGVRGGERTFARRVRRQCRASVCRGSSRPRSRRSGCVRVRRLPFSSRRKNLSDREITANAVFNVTPDVSGAWFDKVQCFCFTEQRLKPHETVEWPVVFFLDPGDFEQDRDDGANRRDHAVLHLVRGAPRAVHGGSRAAGRMISFREQTMTHAPVTPERTGFHLVDPESVADRRRVLRPSRRRSG